MSCHQKQAKTEYGHQSIHDEINAATVPLSVVNFSFYSTQSTLSACLPNSYLLENFRRQILAFRAKNQQEHGTQKSGTTLTEAHQRKLINLLYCTTIMAELHRKTQFALG